MMSGTRPGLELDKVANIHTVVLKEAGREHARDEFAPAWVTKAGEDKPEYKDAVARYVTAHFVRYGMVLFMGPGTTNDGLAQRIFDFQIDSKMPLDLAILTNNLTIFALGADHARKHPDLFRTTQIISTGGTYHPSINSVVGRFAAKAIESSVLRPHIVLLGATGVSFEDPDGALTYHFEDELEAQVALGTCHTDHRILVCDHTKLKSPKRWRGCTVKDLLKNTPKCTIVTSCPTPKESPEERENFAAALKSFEGFIRNLNRSDNRLELHVVNVSGEFIPQMSRTIPREKVAHAKMQVPHVTRRRNRS